MFLVGFIIFMMTFTKGLKHVGFKLRFGESALLSVGAGLLLALIGT